MIHDQHKRWFVYVFTRKRTQIQVRKLQLLAYLYSWVPSRDANITVALHAVDIDQFVRPSYIVGTRLYVSDAPLVCAPPCKEPVLGE